MPEEEQSRVWHEVDDVVGGDPVCWAHLLCPECGAVMGDSHRPGCSWDRQAVES